MKKILILKEVEQDKQKYKQQQQQQEFPASKGVVFADNKVKESSGG